MNEVEVIFRSIKDFFTTPMLKIAIIPLIVTMLILYALFFIAADFGFTALKEVYIASQNGQEVIVDKNAPLYFIWLSYAIIFLFKYSFLSWIAGFLFYTIGTIIIFQFSVILTLIIIGFLTPMILQNLHKKYYSELKIEGYGSLISPLWVLLKSLFIMIFLFILLVPVYFVPVLNIIAFALPLYYFFHKLLNFDVSSTILSKAQYKIIYEKEAGKFRLRTLFLYFISMIPFLTLFSVVFFVIYLGHSYFIELIKLQKEQNFQDEVKTSDIKEDKEDIKLISN